MRIASLLLVVLVGIATPALKRPPITGISHMAVRVSEMSASRSFYHDYLGFEEVKRGNGSVWFQVSGDQYIELVPGLNPSDDRLDHIALRTKNTGQLRSFLNANGIPTTKAQGSDAAFGFSDPDGHYVDVVSERTPELRTATKAAVSSRMMHLGIIVGDAEKSKSFYSGLLGFTEFWRGASASATTVSWINVRLPESPDYLEFMLYSTMPAPTQRGSQHHICLEVEDIAKAKAQLEGSSYKYNRPLDIRTGINRRRQLNLFDPDGTRIELMEPRTVDGVPPASTTLPLPEKR